MVLAAAATAGPLEAGEPIELASDPGGTTVWLDALPRGDVGAILVATEASLQIVDPTTGEQRDQVDGHFRDAAVLDIDGDGKRELILCGPSGVKALPWEGETRARQIAKKSCSALEVVYAKETLLVAATDVLQIWAVDGELADRGSFGAALESPVRLAAHGDVLAVVGDGGDRIAEWGPEGRRYLQAEGPIVGFAWHAGEWVWTTEAGGGLQGRIFDGAGALATGDADGAELHVLHPELSLLGTVSNGVETATSLPFAATFLASTDLEGDTDTDLVVSDGSQFVIFRSTVGTAPTRGPDALNTTRGETDPITVPSARVHGVNVPLFLGTDGKLASGRVPPEATMIGGVGVAFGSALRRGLQGGGSPAFVAAMETVYAPSMRWHFGIDSAPFFATLNDDVVWHLALLNAGMSFGGPHLRSGAYGTVGLVGLGLGWRTVWTPFETRGGIVHGLEFRLAGLVGLDSNVRRRFRQPTGEVTIAYVTSLPMGKGRSFDTTLPGVAAREPADRPDDVLICRRFAISMGAAAGVSSTALSWDFVGRDAQWDPSWSPAASIACETGTERGGWLAAVDSVPFFAYRVPWNGNARDQVLRHMGTATLGAVLGNDVVRAGPFVTGGIWAAGAGLRAVFTPIGGAGDRAHHGVEFRATALYPPGEAGEGLVMYTFWWDPRR